MIAIAPSGIDPLMEEFINELDLKDLVVVDMPAGNGRFSQRLASRGAVVKAFDLFPNFFKAEGLDCLFADMNEKLPLDNESVDLILCQEGIEHVPDQLGLLREFNRVLKPNGLLVLTTPSNSNMRARMSNFLIESELWRRMPPSEVDSVWFSEADSSNLYYGHLFLLTAQKLRSFAALTGFEVIDRRWTKVSLTSLFLALAFYPLIVLCSLIARYGTGCSNLQVDKAAKEKVLQQQMQISCSPSTLLCRHIFWVMQKERSSESVVDYLREMTRKGSERG